MPHHHMVLPHYMGSRNIDIKHKNPEENLKGIKREDSFTSPVQDIPLLLPQEADGLAASTVDSKLYGLDMNQNLLDQPKFEPLVPDSQTNGSVYDLDSVHLQSEMDSDVVAHYSMNISDEGLESPNERNHDDCVGPRTACYVQVSFALWILCKSEFS